MKKSENYCDYIFLLIKGSLLTIDFDKVLDLVYVPHNLKSIPEDELFKNVNILDVQDMNKKIYRITVQEL